MEKLDAASLAPHIEWLSRFLTFDWVEDSQDLRDVVLDIFWKLDGDSATLLPRRKDKWRRA